MSRGALALTLLGAVFLMPRAGIARPEATSAKYHLLRFYGAKPKAPKSVIDIEINKAADREGLPRGLFHALIHVESRKNPNAVSPVGARGLGQIMSGNLKRCKLTSVKQLFDPVHNLRCSAQILREELDTYGGDRVKALQSYNGGPRCIGRCKESINYAHNVLGLASRMSG